MAAVIGNLHNALIFAVALLLLLALWFLNPDARGGDDA